MRRTGLSTEDSRNPAFDYVQPVRFIECMCTIAIFELRRHFELNRVMQSDTKLLYGPKKFEQNGGFGHITGSENGMIHDSDSSFELGFVGEK